MIIGIDIDDTLTNIGTDINIAAYNYAKKLGKDINDSENLSEAINNNSEFYKRKFKFNYDELKYFLKNIQEEITSKANPRDGVANTIKQLRSEGHKIYIVTARCTEFHDNPYELSKNWLDKNKIEYDKLIVNARDKATICTKENIELFIDDQLNNCIEISNIGIKTIRISNDKTQCEDIVTVHNWNEIYSFIKEWSNK